MILISTLYFGFISCACTAAHRRAAGDHPGVPGGVHRGEVGGVGQEDGGIQNAAFVRTDARQQHVDGGEGVGGLRGRVVVQVFRHAGVVNGLVVHHGFGPALIGINSFDIHLLISIS